MITEYLVCKTDGIIKQRAGASFPHAQPINPPTGGRQADSVVSEYLLRVLSKLPRCGPTPTLPPRARRQGMKGWESQGPQASNGWVATQIRLAGGQCEGPYLESTPRRYTQGVLRRNVPAHSQGLYHMLDT